MIICHLYQCENFIERMERRYAANCARQEIVFV